MYLNLTNDVWITVKDGNRFAREVFHRHYSHRKYKDGRKPKLFVGPGQKMVLITHEANALFVWRKFIDDSIDQRTGDRQAGVNCSVFRNESKRLSSELILEAEKLAVKRWPKERFYTYVNASKIKSCNPGACFKKAGWKKCGITKGGLVVLEKLN